MQATTRLLHPTDTRTGIILLDHILGVGIENASPDFDACCWWGGGAGDDPVADGGVVDAGWGVEGEDFAGLRWGEVGEGCAAVKD